VQRKECEKESEESKLFWLVFLLKITISRKTKKMLAWLRQKTIGFSFFAPRILRLGNKT